MSSPDRSRRSHLFAPAANERIVHKALDSDADAVVLDMEDSIDQASRPVAHDILNAAAGLVASRPTHLRVGMVDDVYSSDDVRLAATLGVEAVRLPKAETVEAVRSAGKALDSMGASSVIHLTIESAAGLERIESLIGASERVTRIVFGERDFLADMGVDEPGPLTDHVRASIAITSRSLRLGAPIDGAFIDLADDDGLRNACGLARSLGFGGKSALHPRQLSIIHEVFTPSRKEIDSARAIVAAYDAALARGEVTTLVGDRFVDEAVVRRARAVLDSKEMRS